MQRAKELGEGTEQRVEEYRSRLTPRQAIALKLLTVEQKARRGTLSRDYELSDEEMELIDEMPPGPIGTGRSLFLSERLKGQAEAKKVLGEVGREWREMSSEKKAEYERRAVEQQRDYREAISRILNRV